MSTQLHEMVVANPAGSETHTWNGAVEDREAAEAVFDARMATGSYLAYKTVTPAGPESKPRNEQIREFDPEADRIMLTPRLVGGSN